MIIAHPAPPPQVYQQHPVHAQKKPPFIAYFGGKHPHVTVRLAFEDNAYVYRLHTPRGWETVHGREDYDTEDGGPVPEMNGISHPDTIENIVIISPQTLPVYFRGAGDAKWVHLNGSRVPLVQAQSGSYHYTHPADLFRMDGGLNIVAVAYPDPE